MPFGDRTGPRGLGPMTGRGLGRCSDARLGGWSGAYRGQMAGFGWGRGRGWKQGFGAIGFPGGARAARGRFVDPAYSSWTPQEELAYLKNYTLGLEEALNATKARMAELERSRDTE